MLTCKILNFKILKYKLTFHNDTILLSPILLEFFYIIVEFFLCGGVIFIIIPIIIYCNFSRYSLYLIAILIVTIFDTTIIIFIPMLFYLELTIFLFCFHRLVLKPVAQR